MKQISVIGSSVCDEAEAKLAEEVGAEIAHSGAALICGGMGGVMEAASRGAKNAGGTVVGILPGLKSAEGNSYTDISILTGMGDGRNIIVASSGDAVIAIGGEFGTLSEIGLAIKNRRPVIGLNTWPLNVKDYCKGKDIVVAKTAKEAVSSALRLIK
ncbi:MAG: TIGR00725 family protein [Candidatus Omnitrophota bacterium]|nr:MAG: TIGR00725 family protein [Candidatus Omnitrophota bacterium]